MSTIAVHWREFLKLHVGTNVFDLLFHLINNGPVPVFIVQLVLVV